MVKEIELMTNKAYETQCGCRKLYALKRSAENHEQLCIIPPKTLSHTMQSLGSMDYTYYDEDDVQIFIDDVKHDIASGIEPIVAINNRAGDRFK